MFLYHDIQWGEEITTIGFYSGDGFTSDSFTLSDPTTYTSDLNLDSSSNVGIPGAYFFRVDQDEVILPRGMYISWNNQFTSVWWQLLLKSKQL